MKPRTGVVKFFKSLVLLLVFSFLICASLPLIRKTVLAVVSSWTQTTTAEFNYGQKDNVAVSSDSFTLASNFISSQLSGTAVNDVYIYDTTADSSSADQVTLGIDPNWRNGVVKTTGTINTTDSGNIQVSVPDNDYTDGNTLELKIVTGGATGTAEYQWRVKDGTYSSSISTSTSLTQFGSTKVYVSFTTGITWTANDVFQIASWFTEQLDATELETCTIASDDRCGTREFPKKSALIATGSNFYIIDAEDNELWLKASQGTDYSLGADTDNNPSSGFGLNGRIYAGTNGASGTGLYEFDFSGDSIYRYNTTDRRTSDKNLSGRNTTNTYGSANASLAIVNNLVNDVHGAVISSKVYTATATNGGVSVINETDGSVNDYYSTTGLRTTSHHVFLLSDGTMYRGVAYSLGDTADYQMKASYNIQDDVGDQVNGNDNDYLYASSNLLYIPPNKLVYDIFSTLNTSTVDGTSNTIYVALSAGLSVIQEKQGDESNGSVKYYTKDEITEEMVGDIRGAWGFNTNSTLADGNDVQDVSVKDADMTSVAGATVVDGVRGKAFQFNGSTQYLKQKVYEDETGANWGPTVHGLSLADGSAFAAVDGVNLAAYAGAANPYMLVMKDTEADVAWGYIDTADVAEGLGSELVTNGGFETFTGTEDDGISDDFGTWVEYLVDDGNGNKIEATTTANSGSYAIKMTYGNARPFVRESGRSMTPGKLYKLIFYTRGDGSKDGGFTVRDDTNAVNIFWGLTGVLGTDYQQLTYYFTAPLGCTSLSVYLYPPTSAGTAYFDDVSLKEVTDIGVDGVHIVSARGGADRNWAGISADFDYNDSAYTFEVRKTDFQITGDMSVGTWVKFDSAEGTGYQIIAKDKVGSRAYTLDFDGDADKLRFYINGGSGNDIVIDAAAGVADTWYHVVGVFRTSDDFIALYVNGIQVDSGTVDTTDIPDSTAWLGIGVREYAGAKGYLDGTIDEPFITAEALTASQITTMFETGCRAMGGTPGTGTCTGIDESSTTNKLAGSQNAVYGVGVDTASDPDVMYVGTSGSGTGALTKLQVNADKQLDSWTTGTSLALLSNNISGGIGVIGGSGVIGVGTDSGFSLLSPGYAGIGGLISGTSGGTTYGFDVGSTTHVIDSFSSSETGSGTVTNYLRGGSNEAMTTGLTPWYEVSSAGDTTAPIALDTSRYYQYKSVVEPSSDGASSPTVSSLTMNYSTLPTAPSGLAHNSSATTVSSITWTWTDNSNNEDGFYVKDADGNTVCTAGTVNVVSCQETGLAEYTSYTRKVVSYNSAGNSSDSDTASAYTSDTTSPDTVELTSPDHESYTNNQRPLFKWKAATDNGSDVASYTLGLQVGDTNNDGANDWVIITNIATTSTTDSSASIGTTDTDQYTIIYESDGTSNYISLHTKSSSQWDDNQNDGKLQQGVRQWQVTAIDNQSNQTQTERTVYVDLTPPEAGISQINETLVSETTYSTSDQTPTFYGKITDHIKDNVVSGPDEVRINLEKKGLLDLYSLHTTSTINITDIQTDVSGNQYQAFSYTPTSGLPHGDYKITLTIKDKTGNQQETSPLYLAIKTEEVFFQSPIVQQLIEEVQDEIEQETGERPSKEQVEEVIKEQGVVVPEELKEPSKITESIGKIVEGVVNLWWKMVNTGKFITGKIGQGLAFIAGKTGQGLAFVSNQIKNGVSAVAAAAGKTTNRFLALRKQKIEEQTLFLAQAYFNLTQKAPGVIKNMLLALANGAETVNRAIASAGRKVADTSKTLIALVKKPIEGTGKALVFVGQRLTKTADLVTHAWIKPATKQGEVFTHKVRIVASTFMAVFFDKEPTRIADVRIKEITPTTAVVYWQTNHYATSKVNYGFSTSYGEEIFSDECVKEHRMELKDLEPGKLYYFEVMSQNKNYAYDAYYTFNTPE